MRDIQLVLERWGGWAANEEFNLIDLHYKKGVSKSAIARKHKCSEGKIRLKLMLAEAFVDACLIMPGAKLEMDEWTHKSNSEKIVLAQTDSNGVL
ncbi:phage antitermination protein [Yersinia canariae]|uniref:Phage antitermination protein n=1 Tax=Yersinia canariae TaxID=2607663 RepID=A0A857F1F3_9GAMM|nr:antiterminator Q family protein [Yersinia canariae]QHB33503.1 phage antitermination protein [Yersinia canariae]